MINFVLGCITGAALAVMYPPVFRFVAAKVAQVKSKIGE